MLLETKHNGFIHRPITTELDKVLVVCTGVSDGLTSYVIGDYMMQSLLLRMTGYLEQKLRCMCWDFATWNLKYRRKLLKDEDKLGEYSSLPQKNPIYRHIRTFLTDNKQTPHLIEPIMSEDEKQDIINNVVEQIEKSIAHSVVKYWNERKYNEFVKAVNKFKPKYFFTKTTLEGNLEAFFNALIDYRNQWAHNTLSQFDNIPILSELNSDEEKYRNPYVWIALMAIMDQFYIALYDKYRMMVESRSY